MKQTIAFLKNEIARVDEVIERSLRARGRLMDEVGGFLAASKGKRLRPMLTLLAVQSQGADGFDDRHIRVAAGVEMVHLATLLHDDVIDAAPTRRGRPSVNARWGEDVAILMADYLFSVAFNLILNDGGPEAVRVLAESTSRMCEGEMFQIEKRDQWLSVDDYLEIVTAKTARLFSACGRIGVLLGEGDEAAVAAMGRYGLDFGVAFQITDDALDYVAKGAKWGKEIGTDISNGKQTLPLIHALAVASEDDRAFFEASLNNGGGNKEEVIRRVARYGGIDAALDMARDYARRSLESLETLPPTRARDLLDQLANYVIDRKY